MESSYRALRRVAFFVLWFIFSVPFAKAKPTPPPTDSVTVNAGTRSGKVALLRSLIVDRAKKFLGTPYRYGGITPSSGFDCSGFVSYVMQAFAVELNRSSSAQAEQGEAVNLDQVQAGDLIVFRRSRRGGVSHVAMVVSNDDAGLYVIHSTCSRGVVVENILESSYWKPKIYKARDVLNTFADQLTDLPRVSAEFALHFAQLREQERQLFLQLSRQTAMAIL